MRAGSLFKNIFPGIILLALVGFGCKKSPTNSGENRAPNRPANPSPADSAANQAVGVGLSWTCSDPNREDTLRYDVYLGESDHPSSLVSQNQLSTSYQPSQDLAHSTRYYWRIVARDNHSDSTLGAVWQFTTSPVHATGEEHEFPLGNSGVNITMVWIPAGAFMMGSPDGERGRQEDEGPVHEVRFAKGFWMGKYEVTQGEWEAVMGFNPSDAYGLGANYPVYNVSWDDIQWFEQELGGDYRLPSESEWEYACRAGSTTRYYWGDDPQDYVIPAFAWFYDNSSSAAHPVGSKLRNAWGLRDMSGNVYEWCEDWYHDGYSGAPTDGSAWLEPAGSIRVSRGGSWLYFAESCRSGNRTGNNPGPGLNDDGFRLVRDE